MDIPNAGSGDIYLLFCENSLGESFPQTVVFLK